MMHKNKKLYFICIISVQKHVAPAMQHRCCTVCNMFLYKVSNNQTVSIASLLYLLESSKPRRRHHFFLADFLSVGALPQTPRFALGLAPAPDCTKGITRLPLRTRRRPWDFSGAGSSARRPGFRWLAGGS